MVMMTRARVMKVQCGKSKCDSSTLKVAYRLKRCCVCDGESSVCDHKYMEHEKAISRLAKDHAWKVFLTENHIRGLQFETNLPFKISLSCRRL